MQRYNTFNQIHKSLRALLYDTALRLQQTDFAIQAECDAAVERVVVSLDKVEEQAHRAGNHILPAIDPFEPAIADAFKQEQATGLALSKTLHQTIAAIYRTKNESNKVQLGKQLTRAFARFLNFNLDHMDKEEDVLNLVLWRYYSDAEIRQIEAVIRQQTPVEKQPFVAK